MVAAIEGERGGGHEIFHCQCGGIKTTLYALRGITLVLRCSNKNLRAPKALNYDRSLVFPTILLTCLNDKLLRGKTNYNLQSSANTYNLLLSLYFAHLFLIFGIVNADVISCHCYLDSDGLLKFC